MHKPMSHFQFLCKLITRETDTEYASALVDIAAHFMQHEYCTPLQIKFINGAALRLKMLPMAFPTGTDDGLGHEARRVAYEPASRWSPKDDDEAV